MNSILWSVLGARNRLCDTCVFDIALDGYQLRGDNASFQVSCQQCRLVQKNPAEAGLLFLCLLPITAR